MALCWRYSGYEVHSIGRLDHVKAELWLRCLCAWHGDKVLPGLEACCAVRIGDDHRVDSDERSVSGTLL